MSSNRQRRRRRAVMRLVQSLILTMLAFLAGFCIGRYTKEEKHYSELPGSQEEYPEEFLEALELNPELIDFVKGYPKRDIEQEPELTEEELEEHDPLFMQWDGRWGYHPYGDSWIGISGCGPTCLTMVVHMLEEDSVLTPYDIAEYADEHGYYVEDTGTDWALMTDGAREYGLLGSELSLDERIMKRALDNGQPIICSLRKGDFTQSGHFIVICSYNKDGFKVHDPNSRIRSERSWTYDELDHQIRNLWAYQLL